MSAAPPTVSIVIPALDAPRELAAALRSIAAQDYPNIIETVVAAGDDATAEVAAAHGAVVVPNPAGTTPAALNLAISAARGTVIVRCDAQSRLPPAYVSRAVRTMHETGADNVGGMQVPVGSTTRQRAIAAAMTSPIGAGDAKYRIGGESGPAETVYLGVFKRATLQRLGGFDESFLRTQDYEMNHRIIDAGGLVWFEPEMRVEYRPRDSFTALARQYFEYGRWKRRMGQIHTGSLRWRQVLPPLLVVALLASLAATPVDIRFMVVPIAYLCAVIIATLPLEIGSAPARALVPLALVTMHICWGVGFLVGPSRSTRPLASTGA